jgi:hypothetical protein
MPYLIVSCHVRPLNHVMSYSKKNRTRHETRHDMCHMPCLNRIVFLSCHVVRAVFSHDDTVLRTLDVPSYYNINSSVVCGKVRDNLKILPLSRWDHQNEARLIICAPIVLICVHLVSVKHNLFLSGHIVQSTTSLTI